MTKVLLKFKDAVIKEIPIEKEAYTIGRKEENDIVIGNMAVSGFHAKLLKEEKGVFLEDMASTNGTFVNGRKVAKCLLNSGDVILIGNHTLEFISTEKPDMEPAEPVIKARDMDATVLLAPQEQQKILTATEKLDVTGGLIIMEGNTDRKEYELKERVTTIGKDSSAFVHMKGFFAPKVAALVNRRKTGYFITPSGGKELKVNGIRVDQRHDLKDGDVIEVAGLKMQFFLKE